LRPARIASILRLFAEAIRRFSGGIEQMGEAGVFRVADRVFRPWKNGGGETAEIVVSPPGADYDTFDWRVSTAVVAAAGPFSTFPGIDRVLAVLEGGTMILSVAGEERRLDAASVPHAFPGDVAAGARIEGGTILDFNVMVRRPLRAKVERRLFDPAHPATAAPAHLLLLLEERAGLSRFDLVDCRAALPSRLAALAGAGVLEVRIHG
jgi:environmental stress-induced protein Ves